MGWCRPGDRRPPGTIRGLDHCVLPQWFGGIRAVVDTFDEMLPDMDVVVLALPLTMRTRLFMDSTRLALMAEGALLVNVGRGGLIATDALVSETASGRIRAALDVTDPEPLPPDHPLWGCPRCPDHPAHRGQQRRIRPAGPCHGGRAVAAVGSGGVRPDQSAAVTQNLRMGSRTCHTVRTPASR